MKNSRQLSDEVVTITCGNSSVNFWPYEEVLYLADEQLRYVADRDIWWSYNNN